MYHMEIVLYVLKFHFGWVWASCDNAIAMSIWLQIFVRGHFMRFVGKFWFWKENYLIFENFKFWKFRNFHLHHHHVIRNETSTHDEHFPCGTFSYQKSFVDEKQVQRGQSSENSQCPWHGLYLRPSITLRALLSDGIERWTVNRVPARITRWAEARLSTNFEI